MRRIGIGSKLLGLVLTSLLCAILAVVWNATRLFREDNLNSIYVSSDLLTSSKAGEVRVWLDTLHARARNLAKNTGESSLLAGDEELLAAEILEPAPAAESGGASSPANSKVARYWLNRVLALRFSFSESTVHHELQQLPVQWDRVSQGLLGLRAAVFSSGSGKVPALVLEMPLDSGTRVFRLAARADALTRIFAENGPYLFYLVNDEGRIIGHPDPERAFKSESALDIPLVRKMLASPLEREFQEFVVSGVPYLGAYAKVGLGGLAVLSQVPKSIALETGDVLVLRSTYIALFVFAAVLILAYLFVEQITSPVRALSRAARAIAGGDFTSRVAVKSRDEMADLAASFNVMGQEIERKIGDLSFINDASQGISKTLETKKLLEITLEKSLQLARGNRGLAWFKSGAQGSALTVQQNWFGGNELSIATVLGAAASAARDKKPARVNVGGHDLLVAPILQRGEVAGAVVLAESQSGKGFKDEDLFSTGTLLTSASSTFEIIQLLRDTADKARLDKELETAKHVQDTMFPPSSLTMGPLRVESYYTPAAECGGDWWGCVELPGDRVLFSIGDATGHGVPPAMVTATAKAACSVLHGLAKHPKSFAASPKIVLHLLNKAVYESTHGAILMTFFVLVLDRKTGEMTYATASHDPIYQYRKPPAGDWEPGTPGSKDLLDVLMVDPGPRLGENPEAYYAEGHGKLSPGDFLLLYTDGLPEGKNPEKEEYGERKFLRSIARKANDGPTAIREQILSDFREFTKGEPLHDDVTLVVVEWDAATASGTGEQAA